MEVTINLCLTFIDFRTMTHLTPRRMDAFDILFKNFFNNDSFFAPVIETKAGHPVDIFENSEGLHFEIACTGLSKDDINISLEHDVLRVSYDKEEFDSEKKYLTRGIAKRSFNLGYKISSKFDLGKADAEMTNGLLKISIPFAEETKTTKTLLIK